MQIYTTYFSKLNKLPKNIVPVSICGKCPSGFKGIQYKKLAPKYDFFQQWKIDHNNEKYIEEFRKQVLAPLNVNDVINELCRITGVLSELNTKDSIALVCYEKPGDFCHRHLVAEWLTENGYECQELDV